MKKPRLHILVLATCIFAAFLAGFFAGRNLNRTPVQFCTLPGPTGSALPAEETQPEVPGIVNRNTATADQLQTLPGIGPVLASRIIAYREEYGSFDTIGELANVRGIGEKRLEEIWDLVTTGG